MSFSKIIIVLIILIIIGGGVFYFSQRSNEAGPLPASPLSPPLESSLNILKNMKLTSPVFENNQMIPVKYTCDGENVSPPLLISEVPEGTESLVLIMDDPDAPMGTWVHWVVFNINPSLSSIEENKVPQGGIEGVNSFNKNPYGGPCPPSGTHRYFFKLYALAKILELELSAKKDDVEKAMEGAILEQAELIGLYKRQ